MTLFVYISLLVLVAYVAVTAVLTTLPPSLSNTYYQLEATRKNTGYLFTLLCWGIGVSVMAPMLELSEGRWFQFLAFFAGGALCFVGAAPRFKTIEHRIHTISAALCALATIIWTVLMGYWWIPAVWIGFFSGVSVLDPHRRTFWLEMAAFATAYHVLLIIIP
jgi:hypothetical protein